MKAATQGRSWHGWRGVSWIPGPLKLVLGAIPGSKARGQGRYLMLGVCRAQETPCQWWKEHSKSGSFVLAGSGSVLSKGLAKE